MARTVKPLSPELRRELETSILNASREADAASRSTLNTLGIEDELPPGHLDDDQRKLRLGLRAKLGQLGWDFNLLASECAYEQWHRLLFARFLADNGLLLHPEYRAPVSLAECEELAADLDEPDGWAVAGRFAAEILPGIFRLEDPCTQLRLAPEGRLALEEILSALPAEIFQADDSLGWVYQFWQKEKKDEINASERKIGGADLGPVTQLFTENYMVRFLLENSLGAWWAARHPDSPLLGDFEFLRFDEEGKPAAGDFEGWPESVAEVTVMDPCCGSGHFLVEAFQMLWRMRAEEEGLDPVPAQDAVLEENLFGLELDPRCVQIAMFCLALTAWKAGGGWRELPVPHVACSGIPAKAPLEEWTKLAKGDQRLEEALQRLHTLFKDADTLGSLIDPKRAAETARAKGAQRSLEDVDWEEVSPLLEKAAEEEADDPATAVLGADAAGIARAADYLSRRYTLVATNVPYLKRGNQDGLLRDYLERYFPDAIADLATATHERCLRMASSHSGCVADVTPQNWLTLKSYAQLRERLLHETRVEVAARLGAGSFGAISGEVVKPVLMVCLVGAPPSGHHFHAIRLDGASGSAGKEAGLKEGVFTEVSTSSQLDLPGARIVLHEMDASSLLASSSDAFAGIQTGDYPRFGRCFWELPSIQTPWARQQSTVRASESFGGREFVVLWEEEGRTLAGTAGAYVRGKGAWERQGVAVSQMGDLPATRYTGELFDNNTAAVVPKEPEDLPAVWAFLSSPEYSRSVRDVDTKMNVTNATLVQVPFDLEHWRKVAKEAGPLPEPWSDDPTQWLFKGRPEESTEPLEVGVARLVGFRWPEQKDADDLDPLADSDGIVCLPSVAGEAPASDRLEQLLAVAFGNTWTPARAQQLLGQAESKKQTVAEWLRDEFFKQHCKAFNNRPFVWHICDGHQDGFSALVNYHHLDRAMLDKLTYTYLGQDWVERQKAEMRDEVVGAEARLAAAQELQAKLEAILGGEPPYDIYVRWKPLEEQPIGWEPDLNDGVRLNIRPFVEAGVLRSKVGVNWKKDRGKDADGSERHNDLHLSREEKSAARGEG